MQKEIEFKKYETRGSDYHYKQINKINLKTFNAFVYARYIKQINILKEHIQIKYNSDKEIKILDIGCGDGALLYLIKKKCKQYNLKLFGIDTSILALNVAKKKLKYAKFIKTDVYNLKFKNNCFDIVISSDVIEHVNRPDKMLHEIKRVAKKGALIVIGTPIKYTKEPLDKMHYQEFYQDDFITLMRKYFNDCKLTESHNLLYKLIYEKPVNIFGKSILFFRYLINLSIILFNINPFLKERVRKHQLFSYMFVIGKK